MLKKGVKELVLEANEAVQTIPIDEAIAKIDDADTLFVDVRDVRELEREGMIPGAFHAPRGMLEFWLDPDGPYFKSGKIDMNKEMVLFCAGGLRSALAAKSLKEMGFEKVSHIDGGFAAITQSDFKII